MHSQHIESTCDSRSLKDHLPRLSQTPTKVLCNKKTLSSLVEGMLYPLIKLCILTALGTYVHSMKTFGGVNKSTHKLKLTLY